MSHLRMRQFVRLTFLLIALAYPTGRGAAHGGGTPRLVNVPAGPYQLSAWTQPDPIRVGDLHVTAAVTDPASGAPVLTARVEVSAVLLDAPGVPQFTEAFRGFTPNKLLHDVDLEIPAVGDYQITARVTGPAGTGQASFDLTILPTAYNVPDAAVVSIVAFSFGLILYSLYRKFGTNRQLSLSGPRHLETPHKEAIQ